jgi:adenosylmethionine-8-amino-7-oxononanoate aminotransferase
MAEPVVGATTGCVTAVPGYFKAVRDICDRHGALLILDEVMCGMGRTGTMHAWEQEGITPDIQIAAKGLGGGYQPIGGILIGKRIIDAFRAGSGAFMHGHTRRTPSHVPPRSPCRKSSATTTSSTTSRPWASA